MTSYKQRKQLIIKLFNLYGLPDCENLNHSKGQYHSGSEACPVEEEIEKLKVEILQAIK